MPSLPSLSVRGPKIAVRDLDPDRGTRFELVPSPRERGEIARFLGLRDLGKLRLVGRLVPSGRDDWRLSARLGASVVQDCVISSEPVKTRIDVTVSRLFRKDLAGHEASEAEFDGNDENEPLGVEIDLGHVMTEALALELPEFPRASGAELGEAVFAPPGTKPLLDKDLKPFAAIAVLKSGTDDEGDES